MSAKSAHPRPAQELSRQFGTPSSALTANLLRESSGNTGRLSPQPRYHSEAELEKYPHTSYPDSLLRAITALPMYAQLKFLVKAVPSHFLPRVKQDMPLRSSYKLFFESRIG